MKVYALVFDYRGYEELVLGIFSTYEEAKEYLVEEFNSCKYADDIKEYFRDSDYSLVESELNTNKQRKIK